MKKLFAARARLPQKTLGSESIWHCCGRRALAANENEGSRKLKGEKYDWLIYSTFQVRG